MPTESIHPGEILRTEFLEPLGLSQNRLALDLHVPAHRISEIVRGKRRVSADSALRLAVYFHTTPQFWLKLQMEYDLEQARTVLAETIQREITSCAPPIRQSIAS
ncbi:MAG: HigA family addiction module antitoxin [Ardenticatenaceae bacterium]|nr:HigA family addiction module antitoxin [Ardenticatenaceae bacterium]